MNPVVSVIVPVYNSEKFLPHLLNDIHEQLFDSVEFLLIDDGSVDNSAMIIEQFVSDFSEKRIKLIKQKNGGVSRARNTGLDSAKGQYVIFADSDDRFGPDFVSGYVIKIQDHQSDMEFFSALKVDDSETHDVVGKIDYSPIASNSPVSVAKMISNFANLEAWGYPFGYISRKELWTNVRFNPNIKYQEDVLALFQVWTSFPEMKIFVNKELYYFYVQHANSALHSMSVADYWQFVLVDDQILQMVEERFLPQLVQQLEALKASSLMSVVATSALLNDHKNYDKARKEFLKSYHRASFSRNVLLRRTVQFVILKINLRPLVKVVYKKLYAE